VDSSRENPKHRWRDAVRTWTPRVLVLLIAGYVLNMLVAWCVQLLMPYTKPPVWLDRRTEPDWKFSVSIPESWGEPRTGNEQISLGREYRFGIWHLRVWPDDGEAVGEREFKRRETLLYDRLHTHCKTMVANIAELDRRKGLRVTPAGRYGAMIMENRTGLPFLSLRHVEVVNDLGNTLGSGKSLFPTTVLARGVPNPFASKIHGLVRKPWNRAKALPLELLWLGAILNTLFYAGLLGLVVSVVSHNRERRRRRRSLCAHCGYSIVGLTRCPECGRDVAQEQFAARQRRRARRNARVRMTILVGLLAVPVTITMSLLPMLWAHRTVAPNLPTGESRWLATPPEGWPANPDEENKSAGLIGFSVSQAMHNMQRMIETRSQDPTLVVRWMTEFRFGLPLRSLKRFRMVSQTNSTTLVEPLLDYDQGLPSPAWLRNGRPSRDFVPIQPIWLGMLANWLFYSVIVCATFVSVRGVRSRRRRRLGLCPRCAYPRTDQGPCPECGNLPHNSQPA